MAPPAWVSLLASGAGGVAVGWLVCKWWTSPARCLKRQQMLMAKLALNRAADKSQGTAIVSSWAERPFPISRADTALVLIDMQSDFLCSDGRVGQHYNSEKLARMEKTLASVERLLTSCRAAGLTIAHSRSHRYGASVLPELVSPLDEKYDLHPKVRALPGEIVVDKFTFGAFASTELEQRLRERGVTRILLGGVLTNVCIFATAVQAVDRFFRVCLVEDACGAFSEEWHNKAVSLIHEPQSNKEAHHKSCGLYFGEVASVAAVETALEKLA